MIYFNFNSQERNKIKSLSFLTLILLLVVIFSPSKSITKTDSSTWTEFFLEGNTDHNEISIFSDDNDPHNIDLKINLTEGGPIQIDYDDSYALGLQNISTPGNYSYSFSTKFVVIGIIANDEFNFQAHGYYLIIDKGITKENVPGFEGFVLIFTILMLGIVSKRKKIEI